VRGEHEDRDVAHITDPLQDLPAVEGRQADVQHHQIRVPGVEHTQALPPVGGAVTSQPLRDSTKPDDERDVGVVLDDENLPPS